MSTQANTYDWWKTKDRKKVHEQVHDYIKYLDKHQNHQSAENLRHMRLYGNFDLSGLQAYSYMRKETSYNIQNRVTLNVVRSMVDTVVSKITKNKPKPTFLTSGGMAKDQRRAKNLTKFVEGQFECTDFYEKRQKSFKDSCIFGTGAVKLYKDGKDIVAERVFPDEIIIDDIEAFYGTPMQVHQKKYIHKDTLKVMFPKHKGAIATCDNMRAGYVSLTPKHADLILVIESWRLPDRPGMGNGSHSITIDNATLFDETYEKDYFPFVFDRWNERPIGFFGQGLAEQLQGVQLEINKILRTIQVSMHLVSIPKIFMEVGSKIVESHLNNKIGGIIKYAGTPPTPGQLGSIPSDLFSHLDRLYERSYEIAGISQLSAQSSKPAGLNSGKALREYNDIETERFMEVGLRYERGFLQAAKIYIDLAKEIDEEYSEEGGYKVKVHGRDSVQDLSWKDVSMEDDKYVMKVFPTSSLSSTPSGRLQDVQELIEAGFIDQEHAIKLLDFPDLENFYNMRTASVRDIEMQIEEIVEKAKYNTPEPFQNLELGIIKMQAAYLHYKSQNLEEERLELMRRWMRDAKALIDQSVQQVQQSEATAGALAAQDAGVVPPPPMPTEAQIPPPEPEIAEAALTQQVDPLI